MVCWKGKWFGEMWKELSCGLVGCVGREKQLEIQSWNFEEQSGLELNFRAIIT